MRSNPPLGRVVLLLLFISLPGLGSFAAAQPPEPAQARQVLLDALQVHGFGNVVVSDFVMTYGPSGAVRSTFFGNGLQESITLNQRLQPQARQLFNGAQTLMDLRYGFNDIFTGANNGNVMKIDDLLDPGRSRLYFYDKLNRLEDALGMPWSISYSYDRFGNRLSAQGTMSTPNYHSSSLMIDPSTNRILDAAYEYDAAGYMLRDPQRSYRWDAAGRLIAVAPSDQTPLDDGRCTGAGCPPPPDPPSGPGGPLDNGRSMRGRGATGGSGQRVSYEYDYGGRRVVKRHEDGSGRIYFWDEVMGEVLWEFPLGGSRQDLVRGYFNGQLVVENDSRGPGIHFFHRDHLGSTLLTTNFLSPTVACDSFFHPFGQSADTTACDSHVRKFTGKERDPESALDYFGARYPRLRHGPLPDRGPSLGEQHRLRSPNLEPLRLRRQQSPSLRRPVWRAQELHLWRPFLCHSQADRGY